MRSNINKVNFKQLLIGMLITVFIILGLFLLLIKPVVAAENGSEISISMTFGANPVRTGSVLTLKVEEYDGANWIAKDGIDYITNGSSGLKSDDGGIITTTKSANGFPKITFPGNEVKLNVQTGSIGDLRLTETTEGTDEDWGKLAEYKNLAGTSLSAQNASGLVYCNTYKTIEIAKNVEGEFDDTFTMVLKHITSANNSIEDGEDIRNTAVYGGMDYTVFEQATNEEVRSGVTTIKGELNLRTNQYAKIDIPSETHWAISENIVDPYTYTKVEMSGDNLKKLEENLVLVTPTITPITLTTEMVAVSDGTNQSGIRLAETNELVNLQSGHIIIPEYIKWDGRIQQITAIEDNNNETEGVFYNYYGSLAGVTFPDSLTRIGNNAFYFCYRMQGDLIIPDSVTEIGKNAFYYGWNFSSIVLGDSVVTIEESAFYQCINARGVLDIPDSVITIGANAFQDLDSIQTINFGDSVKTIGDKAFRSCTSLSGSLTIPESVQSIGVEAFKQNYLEEINIKTGSTPLTIGSNAFQSTYDLAAIYILRPNENIVIDGAPWGALPNVPIVYQTIQ